MSTGINTNVNLDQIFAMLQAANQTQSTGSSNTAKSETPMADFWEMWEGDNDAYLDWEEGDDVYWSDSGSDDAFWNYIEQKSATAKAARTGGDVSGQLAQIATALGIDPAELESFFGNQGADESLDLQA